MSVAKFERLIAAQAIAKMNIRDVIQPQDVPVTKGLQENIERFRKLDQEIELTRILEHLAGRKCIRTASSGSAASASSASSCRRTR